MFCPQHTKFALDCRNNKSELCLWVQWCPNTSALRQTVVPIRRMTSRQALPLAASNLLARSRVQGFSGAPGSCVRCTPAYKSLLLAVPNRSP